MGSPWPVRGKGGIASERRCLREARVGRVTGINERGILIKGVQPEGNVEDYLLAETKFLQAGLLPGMVIAFDVRGPAFELNTGSPQPQHVHLVDTVESDIYVMCLSPEDYADWAGKDLGSRDAIPTFPNWFGRIKTVTPTGHSFVVPSILPQGVELNLPPGKNEFFVHTREGAKTNKGFGGLSLGDIVCVDVDLQTNPKDPAIRGPLWKAVNLTDLAGTLNRTEGGTLNVRGMGGMAFKGKAGLSSSPDRNEWSGLGDRSASGLLSGVSGSKSSCDSLATGPGTPGWPVSSVWTGGKGDCYQIFIG